MTLDLPIHLALSATVAGIGWWVVRRGLQPALAPFVLLVVGIEVVPAG